MKIGEQFSGVYENEWTDAFLNLNDIKSDDGACINEEEAIVILLNILRFIFIFPEYRVYIYIELDMLC
jgi:hypothetical protein